MQTQSVQPIISVAIIAYNHSKFIAQAIESVLAQQCKFPIEIVISDDCSSDDTGAIIDYYQAQNPSLFRRVDPPMNVGMHNNLDRVWRACRGKYIALLEGDDFWHSPDKLSIQLQFMELHPECTVSGHAVTVVGTDGQHIGQFPVNPAAIPRLADCTLLIKGNYLQTCSVMCRRGLVPTIPTWFRELKLADWPLFLLHAVKGPVGFLDLNLTTYRVHEGGVWSSRSVSDRNIFTDQMWCTIAPHLPTNARLYVELHLTDIHYSNFIKHVSTCHKWAARRAFWSYIVSRRRSGQLSLLLLPWMLIKLFIPGIRSPLMTRRVHSANE